MYGSSPIEEYRIIYISIKILGGMYSSHLAEFASRVLTHLSAYVDDK